MYFEAEMPSVDILLPAYNPLPGWEDIVLQRFLSLEQRLPEFTLHLILINDGSTNESWEKGMPFLINYLPGLSVIQYAENRGKGYALREGVRNATGDILLYTDIDWPYTEQSMIDLIRLIGKGEIMVAGVRDEAYYQQLPPDRKKLSQWLKKINQHVLHLPVEDTQTGLKGFNKNIRALFLSVTTKRYLFDLEFIYILSKKKIRITPLQVQLREGITFSRMNRKVLLTEAFNFINIWLKN
jgi:glycosyltransferase involved in cell wall biosynthesis